VPAVVGRAGAGTRSFFTHDNDDDPRLVGGLAGSVDHDESRSDDDESRSVDDKESPSVDDHDLARPVGIARAVDISRPVGHESRQQKDNDVGIDHDDEDAWKSAQDDDIVVIIRVDDRRNDNESGADGREYDGQRHRHDERIGYDNDAAESDRAEAELEAAALVARRKDVAERDDVEHGIRRFPQSGSVPRGAARLEKPQHSVQGFEGRDARDSAHADAGTYAARLGGAWLDTDWFDTERFDTDWFHDDLDSNEPRPGHPQTASVG